ncbi:cupin domain-containing protein [Micromonospora haikouensis]|uniref:cupin domain-containing protein n=1 Tax=Micromonospora haikouensis TaxID=686309 RepID=UPI00210AC7DD|nr:cupin domain-containing protein [Micromonospora haikouensis]
MLAPVDPGRHPLASTRRAHHRRSSRGLERHTVRAGSTVNIPANAPHNFRNVSGAPARMLCMCTPAGQDEYFTRIGDVLAGKDAPTPQLSPGELAERRRRAAELASTYRSEFRWLHPGLLGRAPSGTGPATTRPRGPGRRRGRPGDGTWSPRGFAWRQLSRSWLFGWAQPAREPDGVAPAGPVGYRAPSPRRTSVSGCGGVMAVREGPRRSRFWHRS